MVVPIYLPYNLCVQAKNCAEGLLLDMSVLGSWVTEMGLKVQALAKKSKKPNGVTSKLADTRIVSEEVCNLGWAVDISNN